MDACADDHIFTVASYLPPTDLASLAFACRRFGGGNNAIPRQRGGAREGGVRPWSLMEESSRRRVSAAKNDRGNPWRNSELLTIQGEESWMAVDQRLHLLKSELVFSRIIGGAIGYVNGDIRHVQARRRETIGYSVSICQNVMKSGRHYAEFILTNNGTFHVGVVRPIHDWSKKKIRHREFTAYCRKQHTPAYKGTVHQHFIINDQGGYESGDVIGLLLNVDEGDLTVFRNGIKLGTTSGLAGHYCWATALVAAKDGLGPGKASKPSLRIKRGAMPGFRDSSKSII